MAHGKHQRKSKFSPSLLIIITLLMVMIAGLLAAVYLNKYDGPTEDPTVTTQSTTTETTAEPTTEPTTIPTTVETEPYITSTASIGVTGDMLLHPPLHASAKTGDTYDFSDMFRFIQNYYKRYDFMIANQEVPLAGAERGYSGYPLFNSPDAFATDLAEAGVDMVLTGNNHAVDMGKAGLLRTQDVVTDAGLLYLGTKKTADDPNYVIHEINGIRVGMMCYTYETYSEIPGQKEINGIPISKELGALVCSFNHDSTQTLFPDVEQSMAEMKEAGVDVTMMFIHWGQEYEIWQNGTQKFIAQGLCDLGVDVIVGGHPHVVQPFDTLTSSTGHTTYCIYSIGNAISSQNRYSLADSWQSIHTEDGMIFGVTFEKWNDGTVNIQDIHILPTWVNAYQGEDKQLYYIMPLDTELESWEDFGVENLNETYDSYKRTLAIVGPGLNEYREAAGLQPQPLEKEKN